MNCDKRLSRTFSCFSWKSKDSSIEDENVKLIRSLGKL